MASVNGSVLCQSAKNEISQKIKKRKWSDRENIKFMELYESEEGLWNVRSLDYKNKDARSSAMTRIVENMQVNNFSEGDVQKKINSMRTTYKQEVEKIKASRQTGSATEEVYVPNVAWFEIADRFLRGVMTIRDTFINLQNNDSIRLESRSPAEISLDSSSRACSVLEPNAPKPPRRLNKKKNRQKKFTILRKFENILSRNTDDEQIFGDYVASSLRGLSDLHKKKLKIIIQKNIVKLQELEINEGNSNIQAISTFCTVPIYPSTEPSSLKANIYR